MLIKWGYTNQIDGVEDHFIPHCCRHCFTTWLRRAGMTKDFIRVLMGGKRRDAIDVYDYFDRSELKQAYLTSISQLEV
jgi:integrase/recombinase XerD